MGIYKENLKELTSKPDILVSSQRLSELSEEFTFLQNKTENHFKIINESFKTIENSLSSIVGFSELIAKRFKQEKERFRNAKSKNTHALEEYIQKMQIISEIINNIKLNQPKKGIFFNKNFKQREEKYFRDNLSNCILLLNKGQPLDEFKKEATQMFPKKLLTQEASNNQKGTKANKKTWPIKFLQS